TAAIPMNPDALAPFEVEAHGEATAKRFVGMLCLMEFYAWFVCFGISALNGPEVYYQTQLTEIPQWAHVILFIGTALPFLCGRRLLRGDRHASRWLVPSLIGIFVLIVIAGAPTAIQRL